MRIANNTLDRVATVLKKVKASFLVIKFLLFFISYVNLPESWTFRIICGRKSDLILPFCSDVKTKRKRDQELPHSSKSEFNLTL